MAEVIQRRYPEFGGRRFLIAAAVIGGVGLVLWGMGCLLDPSQALYSYLAAFTYVTSLALGVLVLMMIGNAMGATWTVVVRRLHEAVIAAFPVLALLFVPIAVGLPRLFVWADPPADLEHHVRHAIEHKAPYLDEPFFIVRTMLYFAVWIAVAEISRRWSLGRDRGGGAPLDRDRALSAAALPLVGLALTFAAFDWLMSLDPAWYSTMFGVYYFAGAFLGGVALVIVLAYAATRDGGLAESIRRPHFHALGRLLLTFVVFWGYAAYFQWMLIAIANRPEEVTFFAVRSAGSWAGVCYALIIGHLAAPFFVLLPRSIKRRPALLTAIAVWILVVHYIDIYWLVLPVLHPRSAAPHWLDLVALAGVGGVATAVAVWRQRGLPLVPEGDPRLDESIAYRSAS